MGSTPGFDNSSEASPPNSASREGLDLKSLERCFTMLPDPVLVANIRREVVFLNPAAQDLLGVSFHPGEHCPPCTEILKTDTGEESSFIERCLRDKEPLNRAPVRLKSREGGWLSLSVTATPITGDAGDVVGCLAVLRDIAADLEAQPDIQSRLITLASFLDHFPMPFFTVGSDLVITHMNRQLEELTGYSREEVVGRMTCAQVLNTAQCFSKDCLLIQSMDGKVPFTGVRRVAKDRRGREIPVVANASIITDHSGKVIGGFEAVRDITPIVEAEQKIEQITEMTQEGILMADENQRITFANSKMVEIVGLPRDQIIGMGVGELLSPQHETMIKEMLENADVEQGEHLRFCSTIELSKISRQDQRVFETCMAASRVGKNIITYIYFRDLTKRIDIERQLRKANSFLNNIIQSSVDGIVVVDRKGNVLVFNEGAESILGYKAEEVVGHSDVFRKFYDPELARKMMRRMRSEEHGPPGKLNPTRLSFTNKKGEEVPVNFSAGIIKDGERELGSVGIFSDLREHERMRRELADLREHERMRRELEETQRQLVQAEKIASLGRLAAGVAHEINNPLAGVLIYADMLMREIEDNEQWRKDLEEIINQTLRCKQIVSRLLEFSRQSLEERVLFDVNEVIAHCVELIRHQALFHNIEIVQDLESRLPQILGNPGELEQVSTNLLLNAAYAMEGRGTITISSRPDPEADQVVLRFSDTGPGVEPGIEEKMFEPFFTTKPMGEGTGLGLSVVYGVIKRHRGTIDVESTSGGGTTFTVRLPLESPPADSQDHG